jgi:hypothetical protein
LLFFSLVPLGADANASYVPDSYLFFTTGTTPFNSSQFVAHLGTLTLYIQDVHGNQLFDPLLVDLTATSNLSFIGPVISNGTYSQQTTFGQLCAVTKVKNKPLSYTVFSQVDGTQSLSHESGNFNTSEFVAELYILADLSSSYYKPGSLCYSNGGTLGTFNVAININGGGNTSNLEYVSVNGQSIPESGPPTSTTPISTNTAVSLPYVDPDNPYSIVEYLFSIIEETSFNLEDAFGSYSTTIAKAQIQLSNATAGTTYEVQITFDDSVGSQDFCLNLNGDKSLYGIDYTLKFFSQYVGGGVSITGDGLSEGVNQENILITGINETEANLAIEGEYKDTLTVSITPVDTV